MNINFRFSGRSPLRMGLGLACLLLGLGLIFFSGPRSGEWSVWTLLAGVALIGVAKLLAG